MSRTGSALVAKFAMTLVFAWGTLTLIDRNPLAWVLPVAVVITVVNYFVVDLLALPAVGNISASVVDGLAAALIAFLASVAVPALAASTTSLIILALLIVAGEYYFHLYLLRQEEVEP